ncbi:MAG: DUF177 domain-containing protein, partial [Bacteroidota bacterium]
MNVLDHFSVPYKGLGNGLHRLSFTVDNEFFKEFEDSHINNGSFAVEVELDKKDDHSVLVFAIKGNTETTCDRCLAAIQLPILGTYEMLLKFGEEKLSNDEIVFIHPETSKINLAQLIYEFILLSVPMIKTCPEEGAYATCDKEVMKRLNENGNDVGQEGNPIWSS